MQHWHINFKLDWGRNLQNLAILLPPAEPLVHLTNWIYTKIRLKLEVWHGYYSIWLDICREFLAKKDISISKKTKWIFILLTAVLFLPASYFICMAEQGNFHAITPGEAYRSAQLDRDELKGCIRRYNLKSVINLRGQSAGCGWYQDELGICEQYGVRHFDSSIPADRSPSPDQLKTLRHIFANAPRPILLHCKAGADRAGLAAALWKVVVNGEPKALARKQLSLRFGHFPFGPTSALDDFLKKWQPEHI